VLLASGPLTAQTSSVSPLQAACQTLLPPHRCTYAERCPAKSLLSPTLLLQCVTTRHTPQRDRHPRRRATKDLNFRLRVGNW
jgi:hypothetical protein